MFKRDKTIDILRGIGISFMVFDHIGWNSSIHTYIQSFHMPLFFIMSGYLWKCDDVKLLSKKCFRNLMVPYIIFCGVYLILTITPFSSNYSFSSSLNAVIFYPTDIKNMPFASALWFLPCMILSKVLYSIISKVTWKIKIALIIFLTTAGMTYSSLFTEMLPFAIEPSAVGIFFLLLGELIKKHKNLMINYLNKSWLITILLFLHFALAMLNGSVDMRSARYHNCILYLINGFIGTFAFWGMAKMVSISNTKILIGVGTVLSSFSQNGMGFICLNNFFLMVIGKIFMLALPYDGIYWEVIRKTLTFIITLVIIMIVTEIIKKSKIRFVLGFGGAKKQHLS